MLDVAREIPHAQLDGTDIDLSKHHVLHGSPKMSRHCSHGIFLRIRQRGLIGKYDLVHVRLLVLVLSGLDTRPVLRRLYQLLKPGGTLQWDDLDCVNMHVKKVDPSVSAWALDEIVGLQQRAASSMFLFENRIFIILDIVIRH
jgi:hypothetical protein